MPEGCFVYSMKHQVYWQLTNIYLGWKCDVIIYSTFVMWFHSKPPLTARGWHYMRSQGVIPCALTTGKGWQSRIKSWDKTFFLTSPWNWISPQKLKKHRSCYSVSAAFQYMMNMWEEVLHRYADIELGHVLGLPELFAKIQKVHTELVTGDNRKN